jgi:hypothetical protein
MAASANGARNRERLLGLAALDGLPTWHQAGGLAREWRLNRLCVRRGVRSAMTSDVPTMRSLRLVVPQSRGMSKSRAIGRIIKIYVRHALAWMRESIGRPARVATKLAPNIACGLDRRDRNADGESYPRCQKCGAHVSTFHVPRQAASHARFESASKCGLSDPPRDPEPQLTPRQNGAGVCITSPSGPAFTRLEISQPSDTFRNSGTITELKRLSLSKACRRLPDENCTSRSLNGERTPTSVRRYRAHRLLPH